MKGPERLDRVGYPPIVLDPGEIVSDGSGVSWTYNAKDETTDASVVVKLVRDNCIDGTTDATKYTFRVEVDHAQIGQLKGCGQSDPEKFPEFRKKNQLDVPDDTVTSDKDKDKDKDKKTVLDPITNFHSPVATAYLDSAGLKLLRTGERLSAQGLFNVASWYPLSLLAIAAARAIV